MSKIWVIAEHPASYATLCSLGRSLSGDVEAVVVGSRSAAEEAAAAGVDGVLWIEQGEGVLFEGAVAPLAVALAQESPDAVLCATSKRMRLLATHLAATARTRAISDATRVWADDQGRICAARMVYGGNAYSTERVSEGLAIVLVSESLLAAQASCNAPSAAPITVLSPAGGIPGVTLVERSARDVESVDLAAARRVVSIGRGLQAQEDLRIIEDFAVAIGAEVGCTRPIAESSGWMSKERYIGVSGAMLKPEVFVAIGLSGQIQHMVGANGARTVVAINKDKGASVFKQADYGLVGDLYEVVPKLTELLK